MNPVVQQSHVRRIVVVFGGGSSDITLVRALGSLVATSGADVSGVFLEDQSLFRLAELPFITEVSRLTTARRPITPRELESQLKVQAKRAENELRRLAESLGLHWSFRTHRGPLGAALAQAARFDLLLLGSARHAPVGEVALFPRGGRAPERESRRPIAVLLESMHSDRHALGAAVQVAQTSGRPLAVFAPDDEPQARRELQSLLSPLGAGRVTIHEVPIADRALVSAAIRRTTPAMLVKAAPDDDFEERRITLLRWDVRCPVLVVRRSEGEPSP